MTQPRFNAGDFRPIMYAMPYGDDLDARFNELVAQISEEERRQMRAAAGRAARPAGPARRISRAWFAAAAVLAVIAAAGLVLVFRPDVLSPAPAAPQESTPPVFRVPQPTSPDPT
ncbi:hypothetical protein [Nonomuraea sp. LPB2021202275-12-8]|uniref:hypothetical protein n=1 Tax=Nonomuraea sp. LPB2021202275-12-8 TaxID=3120159 RepID=UPI00300D6A98